VLKDGACVGRPGAEVRKRVTNPQPKGKCFAFQGRQFCE
jgi:hypothetical protein